MFSHIFQIEEKVLKSRACHRVSRKAGLSEPPQSYSGYASHTTFHEASQHRDAGARVVKSYLAEKKAAMASSYGLDSSLRDQITAEDLWELQRKGDSWEDEEEEDEYQK